MLDAGAAPSLEQITVQQVLAVVQLHDGVMSHAAARRLDKAGWTLDKEELHVEVLTLPVKDAGPSAMEQLVQAMKSLPVVEAARGSRAVGANTPPADRAAAGGQVSEAKHLIAQAARKRHRAV